MARGEDLNWRGKCKHLSWGKVDFAFNPPTVESMAAAGSISDRDFKLQLLHGFTVITQVCNNCGEANSYRTPGRAQA